MPTRGSEATPEGTRNQTLVCIGLSCLHCLFNLDFTFKFSISVFNFHNCLKMFIPIVVKGLYSIGYDQRLSNCGIVI